MAELDSGAGEDREGADEDPLAELGDLEDVANDFEDRGHSGMPSRRVPPVGIRPEDTLS